MLDQQDRLRLAHEKVCAAENKRMRELFNMRNYKEGDQWQAQRNRQITGAKGCLLYTSDAADDREV